MGTLLEVVLMVGGVCASGVRMRRSAALHPCERWIPAIYFTLTDNPEASSILATWGFSIELSPLDGCCVGCGREISRQKLRTITEFGRVIGHSAHSRKKQPEAMKRHDLAKREWLTTPKSSWPTEQIYAEEIQPRLASGKITRIASALGVSEPYAAEIRAGRYRPHPRHWQGLAKLAGVDDSRD